MRPSGPRNLRRGGPLGQTRLRPRQRVRDVVLDRNAVARERDRRRDQLGKREFSRSVFRVRECKSRHCAGNADRERGVPGTCADRLRRARRGRSLAWSQPVRFRDSRSRCRSCVARGGSACSRRHRYCRRAGRSLPARSRSRPRRRPRCRPARAHRRRCVPRAIPARPPSRGTVTGSMRALLAGAASISAGVSAASGASQVTHATRASTTLRAMPIIERSRITASRSA